MLRPYQVPHYERLISILKYTNKAAIDTSPTGCGKTYTANEVARAFGLKIFVICPKSLKKKWEETAEEFGNEIVKIMTYQLLRGQKGRKLNHKYLARRDMHHDVIFTPTRTFQHLIAEGILLVFDEIQNVKNPTTQLHAAHALVSYITKTNSSSRILLLSAIPADKVANAISMVKMLGLICRKDLYERVPFRPVRPTGYIELEDIAFKMNPEMASQLSITSYSAQKIRTSVFGLYTKLFRPLLATQMPPPPIDFHKDIANGFYEMETEDQKTLSEALNRLITALRYTPKHQEVYRTKANLGAMTAALIAIQKSKRRLVVRLARDRLEENPNNKVVLFFNFTECIEYAVRELSKYGAEKLNGQITLVKDRDRITSLFREPNQKCRVIISNPTVGGVGIDLDDQNGQYPRYMYLLPDYNFIPLVQALGRCYRSSTKSNFTARFVYSRIGKAEMHILEKLLEKDFVAKQMTAQPDPSQFPVNYPNFYENVAAPISAKG